MTIPWKYMVWLTFACTLALLFWFDWRCSASDWSSCRTAIVNDIYDWQSLIAGLLAIGGAAFVLTAAHRQIANDRALAEERRTHEIRAARMRLIVQLDVLVRGCKAAVSDIANFIASEGQNGEARVTLPVPSFATDATDLVAIPPNEAEEFSLLAREIVLANETAAELVQHGHDDTAVRHIRHAAATACLAMMDRRNQLAVLVGWTQIQFWPERLEELQRIAADL